jgi:hypothetical protein
MRQFPFILMIAILAACAPAAGNPGTGPDGPAAGNSTPLPSDSNLRREPVNLESSDLLTLESFPLQFTLVLKGSLPSPCHQVRTMANAPDADNRIFVEVYSVVNPNMFCIQVIEPFEVNLPLGSFPAGKYTLWVNGERVAEFDA